MRSEAFTARSWPSIRLPLAFAALGVREKVRASLLTEENKGKTFCLTYLVGWHGPRELHIGPGYLTN